MEHEPTERRSELARDCQRGLRYNREQARSYRKGAYLK